MAEDTATPASTTPATTPDVPSKMIGKYRVEVDREKCISAASCTYIADQVFGLDEKNLVVILSQDGNADDEKLLAAQSCPTFAIKVIDTETNEQVWPVE